MMFSFMISLVGPSGSGKTTGLTALCKSNAYLLSEQKREPTEAEKKVWGSAEPVSTSWYPNFGSIIIKFSYVTRKFKIEYNLGNVGEGDYLVNIVDTCGQQPFFQHSQEQLKDTQGLLFFFDATRDPDEYMLEIINIYNEVKVLYQGRPFPPVVFVVNKQDLVRQWRIASGGHGRELIYQRILGSRDSFFNKVSFMGASALEGWGVEEALNVLMREVVKRINPVLYKSLIPQEEKQVGIY